ncbi:MAG: four helix bundle protein [Candidatus Doudnabacteria bacterium]|nr:four helix bundle protein [Candidatus Doudnabacteria bacterium]
MPHILKSSKYTLGAKIDILFLSTIELSFIAGYSSKPQKPAYLQKTIIKLDLLKLFLQILWEIKALDTKKYIALSEPLNEIGKMLGGWYRQASKENPAAKAG